MLLRSTSVLLALSVVAFAEPAAAFERQWHVGGGLGIASLSDTESTIAPALGLHGAYGLSDMFDARLELVASEHSLGGDAAVRMFSGAAGLAYKVDVLEWIPYVGLLLGYYRADLGAKTFGAADDAPVPSGGANMFGGSVALGLDYAWSRSFGLGAQLRYHTVFQPDDAPFGGSYFTALLRAEYRWGW